MSAPSSYRTDNVPPAHLCIRDELKSSVLRRQQHGRFSFDRFTSHRANLYLRSGGRAFHDHYATVVARGFRQSDPYAAVSGVADDAILIGDSGVNRAFEIQNPETRGGGSFEIQHAASGSGGDRAGEKPLL